MDRYLFAFDMDGTLLNKKKNISLKTKRLLKKLQKQGHVVALASGRPSRSLFRYYNELNLNSPMICYNGAYLFSPKDPMFPKHEFQFPKDVVLSLYNDIKPYVCGIMCETDTEIWVDKIDSYLDKFFWYKGMNVHEGEFEKTLNKNPMTMICKTINGKDKDKILEASYKYPEIEIRFWTGSDYFELYFKKTSKGACVTDIANYYGIDKNHIVVFGDAENDVEMLEVAGYSIAMSNSKDFVKEHAKYISLRDNNHNGIYYTVKALLKGKLL